MRKSIAAVLLVIAAIAHLVYAATPDPAEVVFTPQVPTANRAAGNRVFLERADVLSKTEREDFIVVSGNVVFTKGPMTMNCDSAHYYPGTESFEAFGSIKMEQGDTLFVFADELNYVGTDEVAYLYADQGKKVRMENKDVSLETDVFVYDLRADVGYYTVGGELIDKQNRLTSLEGEYVPSTKEASFYVNVHLNSHNESDTLNIYTDTLYYNTTSHIAELYSPSDVINSRGTIFTTNGLYDTSLDTAALYDRSEIHSPDGRFMTADTMYYDRARGIGRCYGNIFMRDSARSASLNSEYAFFNQNTDSAYATGRLLIREYSQGDTMYLHGRQLNAYSAFDTIQIKAVPADTVAGTPEIPASVRIDTTNIADIYPRVRFYRSDLQGICDSMSVTSRDTTMRMFINPVVWSEDRQIFGNVIELEMNDSTIDRARLPEFAFTSQRKSGDFYDQLSGKEMIAYFTNGELSMLDINGNVEIIMYPEENDSTFNKMVSIQSSFLNARFKGRATEYIKMWPENTGKVTPLFLLRKSMLFLPKFKLFEGVRPLSPADVFVIPKEMDDLMSNQ